MHRGFLRFTALFATFGIIAHSSAAGLTFSDVQGTPYSDAFAYLSENDIVHGYGDGTARPYSFLNRAEALKSIMMSRKNLKERSTWYKEHMPPIPLFADVRESDWFAPYIEVGFEQQIVKGFPDGSFRPAQLLSTEEGIALIMRAFGEQGDSTALKESQYIENRPDQWFTPYINTAIARNLVPTKGRKMLLGTAVSRGEFFEMLYRMHSITEENIVVFKEKVEPVPQQIIVQNQTQQSSSQVNQIVQQARTQIQNQTQQVIKPLNLGQSSIQSSVRPQQTQQSSSSQNVVTNHPFASNKHFSISIPKVGIHDLTVTHPGDPFSSEGVLKPLATGVGHLFSYPGKGGKIMIYGHSSGYPWDRSEFTKIFRKVNELAPGDKVYVTYDGTLYVYQVAFEEAVPASDTSRFNDNGSGEELILYTCWPPDSIAQRYLVHALPVETVALR